MQLSGDAHCIANRLSRSVRKTSGAQQNPYTRQHPGVWAHDVYGPEQCVRFVMLSASHSQLQEKPRP